MIILLLKIKVRTAKRYIRLLVSEGRGAFDIHVGYDELLFVIRERRCRSIGVHHDSLPAEIHFAFFSGTVAHDDIHAALECRYLYFPLEELSRFIFRIRCRDHYEIRSFERACPHAFGIMSVEAYDDADLSYRSIRNYEALFARSIIILLVELAGLCYMHHLAHPEDLPFF